MLDQVAYGALVRSKRGLKKLTQGTLALDFFGDSTGKGDISRIENGKVSPQEATIRKINAALNITEAEMAPIRQSRVTAKDLANLPALDRDDLELLATRFQIADAPNLKIRQLRDLPHEKAKDCRTGREDGTRLLAEAVAAYRVALTVYDPRHMSYNFEKATRLHDDLKARLAALD